MSTVPKSLLLALDQLGDPAVLRVLAKSVAMTLAIFVMFGAAMFQTLARASAYAGLSVPAETAYIASLVITLLAAWLMFRIIALAVLQFFADDVIGAVERRHYPQAADSLTDLPFAVDLANSLQGAGRALLFNALALPVALALAFTAIGPGIVFLLVNAVLIGRELTDMAWLRHRTAGQSRSPVTATERLLLGSAITALMAVPLANLLAPVIGAAAGTHLVHLSRQKASRTLRHE